MTPKLALSAAAACLSLTFCAGALAVPTTFFAQVDGGGATVPDLTSIVQTRQDFLDAMAVAGLTVGTESFEGLAADTPSGDPLMVLLGMGSLPAPRVLNEALDFGPAGTGTITGTGNIINLMNYNLGGVTGVDEQSRYPYPDGGSQYVGTVPEGALTIALDQPVEGFGFFASDVGDRLASISVEFADGGLLPIDLASLGYDPELYRNGDAIYFGIVSPGQAFTQLNIVYGPSPTGMDYFGIDAVSVGMGYSTAVPESGASLTLFALSLFLIGCLSERIRRRKCRECYAAPIR